MRFQQWLPSYYAFDGGLDQVSPPITIKPGVAKASRNYERGVNGGYTRIKGYERYDGRPRPSDAIYESLGVTITGSYAAGNTITGVTSGATAVIVAGISGTFFITKRVGTFQAETINISGSPVATSTGASTSGGAASLALNATYLNLAADQYRADIAVVPGSGSILGVWQYASNVYAFRNNAGGTAAVMHKATSSGWTAVSLGRELSFTSGGTTEIAVGNTITGAISGATAVVTQVAVTSGTWAAGTAAGKVVFASQTGTFQAENLDIGASLNVATIAGNSSAITLLPSGRYEFVNNNFGGAAGTTKMYWCDGVNRAFEFNGTAVFPIDTGMTTDTPQHIAAFKKHLFLSFEGSVQHSSIGSPLVFAVVTGAAELAVGDSCTGLMVHTGGTTVGAMTIYTRNKTFVLYGNSSADWNLVEYNPDSGAIEWTPQFVGQGVVLDDRGITLLATSQNFGNFASSTVSEKINPYLKDLRDTSIASCVVREKNQYRLFFSGGDAIYMTFQGAKVAALMPITLTHPVTCICSQEDGSGVEAIYFGSTDGMVYQAEKGTSFDGGDIDHAIEIAYHHLGSPRQIKHFHKAVVEVSGSTYCGFSVGYSLGYGSTEIPQPSNTSVTSNLAAASWDSFVWDSFFWDGQTLIPSEVDLDGDAENISLVFAGASDEYDSFTLNGAVISYSNRRGLR